MYGCPMKLHILNDLRIEFEDFEPPVTDADVVILAGDIGVGMDGLRWAEMRYPDRPGTTYMSSTMTRLSSTAYASSAASCGRTLPCLARWTSSSPCSRRGGR
jgi:hypothetical protein